MPDSNYTAPPIHSCSPPVRGPQKACVPRNRSWTSPEPLGIGISVDCLSLGQWCPELKATISRCEDCTLHMASWGVPTQGTPDHPGRMSWYRALSLPQYGCPSWAFGWATRPLVASLVSARTFQGPCSWRGFPSPHHFSVPQLGPFSLFLAFLVPNLGPKIAPQSWLLHPFLNRPWTPELGSCRSLVMLLGVWLCGDDTWKHSWVHPEPAV